VLHVSNVANNVYLRRRAELPAIGRPGCAYIEEHFTLRAFSQRPGAAYRRLGALQ
jgi:hypothetical protein